MLAFSSVGFSCEWIRVVKAHPWLAGLILALSLPADESRPIGFETASVNILRRVKLGSGLCFTGFHRTMTQRLKSLPLFSYVQNLNLKIQAPAPLRGFTFDFARCPRR